VDGAEAAPPSVRPAVTSDPASMRAMTPERRVVARVLQRLMARVAAAQANPAALATGAAGDAAPPTAVASAVVSAVEDEAKRRRRAATGQQPVLLDALLAADRLAGSSGGGMGDRVGEAVAAAGGNNAATALAALAGMSRMQLGGAHWLPSPPDSEGRPAPPPSRSEVAAAMRAIYARELPRAGLVPDRITLNTMVLGLANVGDAVGVQDFVRTQFPARGVSPDARTYRAIIRMHVQGQRAAEAEAVLRRMREAGITPDKDCWGWCVHGAAREGRLKDAVALVGAARSAGLELPHVHLALLRRRLAEAGFTHPDVPPSPAALKAAAAAAAQRSGRGRATSVAKTVAQLKSAAMGGGRR